LSKLKTPLIVFLTDFGNDAYTGLMKGIILNINPRAIIISLTNHIQNHNIRQGAFILLKSYQYFPPNSIFLIVVDPGVGSSRKAIGVQLGDYYFIGPDNGIISPILSENSDYRAVELRKPTNSFISNTFHGRDIFAPAAAELSLNYSFEELGNLCTLQETLEFHWDPETWTGEVIFIDHFGNIITNIPPPSNLSFDKEYLISSPRIEKKMKFRRTYNEGSCIEPFVIVSSFGTVEISLRKGKASESLDIKPNDMIRIS